MTDNAPICTGDPYTPHTRSEMYEIETEGALQPEDWDSYHCPTCRIEVHIPSHD